MKGRTLSSLSEGFPKTSIYKNNVWSYDYDLPVIMDNFILHVINKYVSSETRYWDVLPLLNQVIFPKEIIGKKVYSIRASVSFLQRGGGRLTLTWGLINLNSHPYIINVLYEYWKRGCLNNVCNFRYGKVMIFGVVKLLLSFSSSLRCKLQNNLLLWNQYANWTRRQRTIKSAIAQQKN